MFFLSLGILVKQQGTSRLSFLATIQRMSFEIPVLHMKKITFHDYDWVRALLDIFFIDIVVCSIVWRTDISMKYSDAANTYSEGGMNFNCAYKEVSKIIPFILESETVVWCEGEPVSSSMYSPSQISIRFRSLYSCPCKLFASFLYACPFPQFCSLL